MAVIETLAVRVYIQHVGGSCAPCGRILIISHDRTPKQLVCTSLSLFVFFVFFINTFRCFLPRVLHACPVFEMHHFHVYFTAICVAAKITMSKKKKKKASDPLACDIDFPSSDAILHSQEPMLYSQAGSVLT